MAFSPRRLSVFLFFAGALCAQDRPIGQLYSGDATVHGSMQLTNAGMEVMSGAEVTAGTSPARLKLTRGGEVRICPQTRLSVAASKAGDLLLGMNTGAVEADYKLGALADSIVTPDFRILLAGPAAFHVALDANAKGDLCVRTLAGNNAALLISELAGTGSYQVKPGEQVVFHGGKIAGATNETTACGCSAGPPPTEIALLPGEVPQRPPTPVEPPPTAPAPVTTSTGPTPVTASSNSELTKPLPPDKPGDVHVEVDTPFVFRAAPPAPAPEKPAPVADAVLPTRLAVRTVPMPPPDAVDQPKRPEKKGFFHRLSAFFGSVFH